VYAIYNEIHTFVDHIKDIFSLIGHCQNFEHVLMKSSILQIDGGQRRRKEVEAASQAEEATVFPVTGTGTTSAFPATISKRPRAG
jgi:hypothetical protein